MSIRIKDGGGKAFEAKVNKDLQLNTKAITENSVEFAAEKGETYFAPTNIIFNSDNSAEASLSYIKNVSTTHEVRVDKVSHSSNQADTVFRIYANVATVSAATTVAPVNSNFRSGKTADVQHLTYTTAARGFTGGSLMIVTGKRS